MQAFENTDENLPLPASGITTASADTASKRKSSVLRPPSWSNFDLLGNVRALIPYRDLIYTFSIHRIKIRYKQTLLGIAWAILQPFIMMMIFTVIFSIYGKMPTDGVPYPIFAYTGILPWTFFATALANATNGMVSNAALITRVYFPREILPISYVIAALLDFLLASTVLMGMMIYFDVQPTLKLFYIIPLIMVLLCFTIAMALFLSATQVRFRDIGVAMPFLLQVWMFATPIVYPLTAVPERFRLWYQLNPMVGVIENFRRTVLFGEDPNLVSLSISALLSILLLVAAYIYFKRMEATMADVI